jgi:hypothetical protein
MGSAVGIAAMRRCPVRPFRNADTSSCIGHDAARPIEHALALGREALEARAPQHELDPEAVLQLLHPGRQGLLGHAAGFGRMAEMLLAGEREQEVQLVDHGCIRAGHGADGVGRAGR